MKADAERAEPALQEFIMRQLYGLGIIKVPVDSDQSRDAPAPNDRGGRCRLPAGDFLIKTQR